MEDDEREGRSGLCADTHDALIPYCIVMAATMFIAGMNKVPQMTLFIRCVIIVALFFVSTELSFMMQVLVVQYVLIQRPYSDWMNSYWVIQRFWVKKLSILSNYNCGYIA